MIEEIIYKGIDPSDLTEQTLQDATGNAVRVCFGDAHIDGVLVKGPCAYGEKYTIGTFEVAFVSETSHAVLADGMTSFMVQDDPWAEIRGEVDEKGYVVVSANRCDELSARQHISQGIDFPIDTEAFAIGDDEEDVFVLIHRI